jgi:hypothetical protein
MTSRRRSGAPRSFIVVGVPGHLIGSDEQSCVPLTSSVPCTNRPEVQAGLQWGALKDSLVPSGVTRRSLPSRTASSTVVSNRIFRQ